MLLALRSWWKRPRRQRGRRSGRCRLGVERLENRIVFAGDTLATATALSFLGSESAMVQTAQASGFLTTANEVDLYKVSLHAGNQVAVSVSAQTAGSGLQSLLRIFDASGTQVALDDQEGGNPRLTFQAAAAGDYYVGVSASGDDAYDPNVKGSGQAGSTTGLYQLNLSLTSRAPLLSDLTGGSFRLTTEAPAYGETVSGSFTVENRGGANSSEYTLQLVLSSGTVFDSFDPSQTLPVLLSSAPPAELGAGQAYTTQFTAQLPSTAPTNLPSSGTVYVGLLITPDDPTTDSGKYDKSGVHRGEDFENLTIVTPAPAGTTDLSALDPNLNTRVVDAILGPGLTKVYTFTVTAEQGMGRLTALVAPTNGSTLVPRLTLSGTTGQVLIQSDSGSIVQDLQAGTYLLAVSAESGGGSYQLITEFVLARFIPVSPFGVSSMVTADVNGDGIPDLIIANFNDATVSVLLGNGDGTFQPEQTYAVGERPASVAVADLNGDGKPDIVVANHGFYPFYANAKSVSVLLGNGDGTFQPQRMIAVGRTVGAVAVADLNGDGIPDIVTASGGNTVSVLLGKGDGSFQPPKTFAVGSGPTSVAVADFNGDGPPTSSPPIPATTQ